MARSTSTAQCAAHAAAVTNAVRRRRAVARVAGRRPHAIVSASSASSSSSSDVPGAMRSSSSARVISSRSSKRTAPSPAHSCSASVSCCDSSSGYGSLEHARRTILPLRRRDPRVLAALVPTPTASSPLLARVRSSAGSASAQARPSSCHAMTPTRRLRGSTQHPSRTARALRPARRARARRRRAPWRHGARAGARRAHPRGRSPPRDRGAPPRRACARAA